MSRPPPARRIPASPTPVGRTPGVPPPSPGPVLSSPVSVYQATRSQREGIPSMAASRWVRVMSGNVNKHQSPANIGQRNISTNCLIMKLAIILIWWSHWEGQQAWLLLHSENKSMKSVKSIKWSIYHFSYHYYWCQEGAEEPGVAVPVGGTPVAPRALGSNKRLGEGVRPAQLIPRTQAKQVTFYIRYFLFSESLGWFSGFLVKIMISAV